MSHLQALVEFKEAHGHCRVPMTVPELGKWAKYQRDQYCQFMRGKKAKITKEKIDKLMSLGFEESLEERVALGLADVGDLEEEQQGGSHLPGQHQELVVDHAQEEVPYQQQHPAVEGQVYAENYQQFADPNHAFGGQTQHQAPPGPGGFHYQHGSVHYQS